MCRSSATGCTLSYERLTAYKLQPNRRLPKAVRQLFSFGKYGGRTWARTKDPLIKSQLLYQLSYASIPARF